jgi:Flp pilus assembly protein TadB
MGLLFSDPIGQTMVMIGSSLMVTGAFVMKRIITIKV